MAPGAAGQAEDITAAFEGLQVLDLTEILASPTSGRILGEYGADVVKINAPSSTVTAHGIVNRGKRSMLLNVEAERGQVVFWELAARSDVIIQNYPEGTADRYGIGYRHVRARFPEVVYVSVTCYGEGGLWGARRGYEVQGQAVTGMMERAGGDHHVPEVLGPYNVVDFGSGVMTAFAASLGIFHRTRTGAGGRVTASLAQTATYHQATFMLDYPGRGRPAEPRGPEALGDGPFQRYYQVRDGWIFLGMKPSQWPSLKAVPWLADAAKVSPADADAVAAGERRARAAVGGRGRQGAAGGRRRRPRGADDRAGDDERAGREARPQPDPADRRVRPRRHARAHRPAVGVTPRAWPRRGPGRVGRRGHPGGGRPGRTDDGAVAVLGTAHRGPAPRLVTPRAG